VDIRKDSSLALSCWTWGCRSCFPQCHSSLPTSDPDLEEDAICFWICSLFAKVHQVSLYIPLWFLIRD